MEVIDGNYKLDINPKKVCRLCLSQPQNLQNIFSNSIVDGYITSIPDMLSFTVDITVSADDKMPSKICSECKKQIVTFYTFKQKTKRTEQALISMFVPEICNAPEESSTQEPINCSFCDVVCDGEAAFIEHAQQEHPDYPLFIENASEKGTKTTNIKQQEIEIIGFDQGFDVITNDENSSEAEIITDVTQIEEHDVLSIEEEHAPIQSARTLRGRGKGSKRKLPMVSNPKPRRPKIEKPSTSKILFKSEISDFDDNLDINDDFDFEQTGSESLDLYECELCATQFAERDEYLQHCKEHDDGADFRCDTCNAYYSDEEQLANHDCDTNENVNEEDLICVPCNKRMKSLAQLRQHNKMHDSMNLIISYLDFYPCNDCCLLFVSKDKLNEHNASEHPEKGVVSELPEKIDDSCTDYQFLDGDLQPEYKLGVSYACGECNQSYQLLEELKYHVILHANKFECPIEECGCQYDQMSRLSIHVLNKHINTKNLQCLHCSQSFTTYDDLQNHLKHFCKEKKYKCFECDKKFFSKKALITHLRTLKEKKFKCKICGKAFKQQGELTIHTRSHTNERPFQCTICSKSYKTSSMRAAHMDSHISGKTFECTLCDKKLQSRTSYRNHMKRHTEEKKHVCEYCDKRFFTRYHQKLHQSKIHKERIESGNSNDLMQLDDAEFTVYE